MFQTETYSMVVNLWNKWTKCCQRKCRKGPGKLWCYHLTFKIPQCLPCNRRKPVCMTLPLRWAHLKRSWRRNARWITRWRSFLVRLMGLSTASERTSIQQTSPASRRPEQTCSAGLTNTCECEVYQHSVLLFLTHCWCFKCYFWAIFKLLKNDANLQWIMSHNNCKNI